MSDAATQRSAAGVAGPASACTPVSQSRVDAGGASGSASRHASGTPSVLERSASRLRRRRRRAPTSGAALGGLAQRLVAGGRRSAPRPRARSRPPRTLSSVAPITSSASASSAAARLRGRGRVVELVREPGGHRARAPRAARGSARIAVIAAHQRRDLMHDPLVHRRRACSARRRKSVAGITARRALRRRHHPRVDRRLGEGGDRRPIQVGAVWRLDGLESSPSRDERLEGALEQAAAAPSSAAPSSSTTSPGSASRRARPPPTRRAPASSRSSKRSTGRRSADVTRSQSCLGQVLVDERDRHRALADRARHALDRARADVAGDEHAGHARLQQETGRARAASRRALASRPARMNPRSSRATTPSSQSVRGAAPMNTKHASTSSTRSVAVRVADPQARAGCPSPSAPTACARVRTSTLGSACDLLDQVVRHRLGQRVAAHEHRHAAGVRGEVDRRLAGRVGAADHDHVLVRARARLGQRGAVVDALRR